MKRKVLVVDDSATVREQVVSTLAEEQTFELVQAEDGAAALQALEQHPDTRLVISDVNMPKINGIELAKAIRASGKFPRLSLVMLTTEGRTDLVAQAKEAGARAWLVKPFKPELLLAAARKLTGC